MSNYKQAEDEIKCKVIGVTKPVVDDIPDSEAIISYAARVSNPKNQHNFDSGEKLLKYCIKHSHWSVFETVSLTMEIEAPRDIARQILRHRSFSFQEFCIAGDSQITMLHDSGRSYKKSIEDLYLLQNSKYASRSNWYVRHYNEDTKKLEHAKIKEVFNTGEKECFELTLETNFSKSGKKIKATADHKVFTLGGWKRIGDLTTEDFVAENGVPVYQDKMWLEAAKQASISSGTGVEGIAEMAGVSYHTIRKWLRVHGLQFTHKEVAEYTEIWNKYLPSEMQPMYNKSHSESSRVKMRKSSRRGEDSEFYKDGSFTLENGPFRKAVTRWSRGFLMELLRNQDFKCAISGKKIDKEEAEVDHILPVYARPDLAYDKSNLQVICRDEHLSKTKKEELESRLTVKYKKVASIVSAGVLQTYDMEIDAPSHNYIANGIVTHNSQRYAEAQSFVLRECRMQDLTNRQNSFKAGEDNLLLQERWQQKQDYLLSQVLDAYTWAIDHGIAKEVARVILPEGLTMSRMYMNGTLRSWLHYIDLREKNGTQLEHIWVAKKCKDAIEQYFPTLIGMLKGDDNG